MRKGTYISDLPCLSLRDLSNLGLIPSPSREEIRIGRIILTHTITPLVSYEYLIKVEVSSSGEGTGSLSLECLWDGKTIKSSYPLIKRKSNLPSGGSFFIILSDHPQSSTKLYLSGGVFYPRQSLSFLEYETSAQSKTWREIERTGNLSQMDKIFRKGGKVHYRGKLTPYGKRLHRHWDQIRRVYTHFSRIPAQRRRSIGVLSSMIEENPI